MLLSFYGFIIPYEVYFVNSKYKLFILFHKIIIEIGY